MLKLENMVLWNTALLRLLSIDGCWREGEKKCFTKTCKPTAILHSSTTHRRFINFQSEWWGGNKRSYQLTVEGIWSYFLMQIYIWLFVICSLFLMLAAMLLKNRSRWAYVLRTCSAAGLFAVPLRSYSKCHVCSGIWYQYFVCSSSL